MMQGLDAITEGILSLTAADGVTPNPGVIPRNRAQRLCFANAYAVDWCNAQGPALHIDPDVLHWPNTAGGDAPLFK
jgi:hypothetical protein